MLVGKSGGYWKERLEHPGDSEEEWGKNGRRVRDIGREGESGGYMLTCAIQY